MNAAITSALVGIHNKQLGRGPKSASTFCRDNVVVTLLHEVLTPAEKTLLEGDHAQTLHNLRGRFQEIVEDEYRSAVERLTGREVLAFISGNAAEAELSSEIVILDSSL